MPGTRASDEQRERAFEETRETLARLRKIITEVGFSEAALPVAADLYRHIVNALTITERGDQFRSRNDKIAELCDLEELGEPSLFGDPSLAAIQRISRLPDDELERRLEVARARKALVPMGVLEPFPLVASADDVACSPELPREQSAAHDPNGSTESRRP
jgi:hypothetical protein